MDVPWWPDSGDDAYLSKEEVFLIQWSGQKKLAR